MKSPASTSAKSSGRMYLRSAAFTWAAKCVALAGAFAPDSNAAARAAAVKSAAEWLGRGDREAVWKGELRDDGSVQIERVWRGVSDVYPIEASFLVSAEARKADPLMGWSGSGDTQSQVTLKFASREEAVAYAERHGIAAVVHATPPRRLKLQAYADNFR